MIYWIIKNEWLQYSRDKRLKWLTCFLMVISAVALWHQLDFQSQLKATRMNAQQESRNEWLSQELKHPHIAAHFGNYAYKKPSLLHCFDPGLSIYTGTSVYMEPHRQNDFLFSIGQESDTGLRFGWLSPALICQLLLPLLIIVLSFSSINGEYEKGTMSLLLSQGVTLRQLLFAKTLAVFLVFETFITTYLLITALAAGLLLKTAVDPASLTYLWLVYSCYCLIWSLLGVYVSFRIRNVGVSVSVLLFCWMFTNILLPRIAANIAENVYPVATNYQFRRQIAEAIERGLDGHDPQSNRARRIEQELLAKYKVDSVEQLPFNFEGYIMQQGEEYSSKVYDNYFGDIFNTLKRQKRLQSWLGLGSPFVSLRNISMTASNASLESEIDFQQQAEYYRRAFVQDMNNDMRDHSTYGSFDTYKVREGKYNSIGDVEIKSHTLAWSFPHIIPDNIGLLCWTLVLLALMYRSSNTTNYL
jgi:ABC-2 type transport system permease protein